MAGVININLDKAVSTAINVPTLKGVPLYARVDNEDCQGAEAKTPEWVEKSKRLYSSPDNVRRLFITMDGVFIELYRPIKGSSNKVLTRKTSYNEIDMHEVMGSCLRGERKYRITKTGFGALVNPWVFSNIEEVYFDMTVLLSEDIQNMGFGNLYNRYSNMKSTSLIEAETLRKVFDRICKGNSKHISERFIRLRTIGLISNLADVYNNLEQKRGTMSLEDSMKPWYMNDIVANSIKNPECVVAIHNIENVPKMNTKYSCKDGIYAFDRDVLMQYFSTMETRINDYRHSINSKKIDDKKDKLAKRLDGTKSSFEITLDSIYDREGPQAAAISLQSSMFGVPQEERATVLNKMSKTGREKYRELLYGRKEG